MERHVLSAVFDRRSNGLNLLRLLLAIGVIVWHSFPLTGHTLDWPPARQLLSNVWVDGFFAISGYLIAGSWIGRPKLIPFLRARALRILPGYYLCLLFTALVLAPIMVMLTGGHLRLIDELKYIKANAALWVTRYDIGGTPFDIPYPHVWNGSIWTLAWECLCYLGVAAIGLLGLLRRRYVVLALFVLAWCAAAIAAAGLVDNWLFVTFARFTPMFMAGVVLQVWADRIPVNRGMCIGSVVIVLVGLALPDYRLLAALPLAYALLALGSSLRSPKLHLHNDISYGVYVYAFPVQQSLAMLGAWRFGILPFAALGLLSTLPFAAASWFGLERRALLLKSKPSKPSVPSMSSHS